MRVEGLLQLFLMPAIASGVANALPSSGSSIGGSAWGRPRPFDASSSNKVVKGSSSSDADESSMYISEDEVMRSLKRGSKKEPTGPAGTPGNKLKKNKSGTYYEHFEDPGERDNEIGLGGILANLYSWTKQLPKVNFVLDPIINFKLKQRIRKFGASITLGMDYLSELAQWRAYCAVEDALVGGRFSLRGSELGWTKSWWMNLGLGEESSAKVKLRLGLNLKNYKAYARVRFRAEPLSQYDIGEGLSCAGKLPIYRLLPNLHSLPLKVEYRVRVNTPQVDVQINKGKRDGTLSLSTGIDSIDLSLEELNFCLEWDEQSPLWDLGIVRGRSDTARKMFNRIRGSIGTSSSSGSGSSNSASSGRGIVRVKAVQ